MQGLMTRAAAETACGDYGGALCHLNEAITWLETAAAAASPAEEALHTSSRMRLAACYSQRAACHREMGNLRAAISEMDRAIAILNPVGGAPTVCPLPQANGETRSAGPAPMVGMLIARGLLLEETEQHELSLADYNAALQADAIDPVALGAATRLRAMLKGKHAVRGRKCAQTGDGWKSVPRPGIRVFENRGKAGAAF